MMAEYGCPRKREKPAPRRKYRKMSAITTSRTVTRVLAISYLATSHREMPRKYVMKVAGSGRMGRASIWILPKPFNGSGYKQSRKSTETCSTSINELREK